MDAWWTVGEPVARHCMVYGTTGKKALLAEGVRFELTVPCGTPHFKCGALDHSATPPIHDTIHFLRFIGYAKG